MKMSPRIALWIAAPIALSAGVLWLSAQDWTPNEGVRIGDLAEKVQAREKAVALRESALNQLEQRLNTFQAILAQDQQRIRDKDKALDVEKAQFEEEKKAERAKLRELKKTYESEHLNVLEKIKEEQTRELEKIREERDRLRKATTVDDQLIRTYEAMEPGAASKALQELAKTNFDIAVGLLSAMSPKKAAKVMDQLVSLPDTKLTADLSERIGLIRREERR